MSCTLLKFLGKNIGESFINRIDAVRPHILDF